MQIRGARLRLAAAGAFLGLQTTVFALDSTWSFDGSGTWSVASNWTNGVPNGEADSAELTAFGTTSRSIFLDTPITLHSLRFAGDTPYALATVGSDPLIFAALDGNATLSVGGGNFFTRTISAPMTINAPLNIDLGTAGTLLLSGSISGTHPITVRRLSNVGNVNVGGDNGSWAGVFTLNSGTAVVSHSNALGTISAGSVINGGTLILNAATSEPITLNAGTLIANNTIASAPLVTGGQLRLNQPQVWSTPLVASNATVTASASCAFNAVSLSGATLTIQNAGTSFGSTLSLQSATVSVGGATISAPIYLSGPQSIIGGSGTISGAVEGSGTLQLGSDFLGGSRTIESTTQHQGDLVVVSGTTLFNGHLNHRGNTIIRRGISPSPIVYLNGQNEFTGQLVVGSTSVSSGLTVYANHPGSLGQGQAIVNSGTLVLNADVGKSVLVNSQSIPKLVINTAQSVAPTMKRGTVEYTHAGTVSATTRVGSHVSMFSANSGLQFSQLILDGGTFGVRSGTTYSSPIHAQSGTLSLAGTLSSAVTLQRGRVTLIPEAFKDGTFSGSFSGAADIWTASYYPGDDVVFSNVDFGSARLNTAGWVSFAGASTLTTLRQIDSIIRIPSGATVIADTLELIAGVNVEGNLQGISSIKKSTNLGLTRLNDSGLHTATIEVQRGTVYAESGSPLGSIVAPTIVTGSRDATIQFFDTSTQENFYLNNARGFPALGALLGSGTLNGNIDLGEEGSIISGQNATIAGFYLNGTVTGGDLSTWGVGISGAANHTGVTHVRGKHLTLRGNGRLASTSRIELAPGASLQLFNDTPLTDRIADNIPIHSHAGMLEASGKASEQIGSLELVSGETLIRLMDGSTSLVMNHLSRQPGSRLRIDPANTLKVMLPNGIPLNDGIVGGWLTNGLGEFFTLQANQLVVNTATTSDLNSATAASNVSIFGAATLTSPRTLNSICVTGGPLDLGGHLLVVDSGGVSASIANGTLSSGIDSPDELFLRAWGTVSASIADAVGSSTSLVTAGSFTLSGDNSFTGKLYVTGTLSVSAATALPVGNDVVLNGKSLKLDYTSNEPLQVGEVDLIAGTLEGPIALSPAELNLEQGYVLCALAGNGPITKSGPQVAHVSHLGSQYSGSVTVNDGVLIVGTSGFLNSDYLGTGTAIVNAGARLQLDNMISSPVVLNGGELTGVGLLGSVDVFGESRIMSINGRAGFNTVPDTYEYNSLNFTATSAPIIVHPGAALDLEAMSITAVMTIGTLNNAGQVRLCGMGSATIPFLLGEGDLHIGEFMKLSSNQLWQDSLNVEGSATLTRSSQSSPSRVRSLVISAEIGHPTATLMLGSDLLIDYDDESPLAVLHANILSGLADGAWIGAGIRASATTINGKQAAIGYAEAADLFSSFPHMYKDVEIDDTTVLLSYTFAGDADLDGAVTSTDFNAFIGNYGATSPFGWSLGDFDYDGKINTVDFNLLAGNFGASLPPAPSSALGAVVPEPTWVAVFIPAIVSLRRRSTLKI